MTIEQLQAVQAAAPDISSIEELVRKEVRPHVQALARVAGDMIANAYIDGDARLEGYNLVVDPEEDVLVLADPAALLDLAKLLYEGKLAEARGFSCDTAVRELIPDNTYEFVYR